MRLIKIVGMVGLVFGAPIELRWANLPFMIYKIWSNTKSNLRKRKTTTETVTTTAESLTETTSTFESPVILPIVDEDGSGDLIAAPMELIPEQRGYIQNFIDEMQSLKDELKDVDWSSIKEKVLIA